MKVIYCSFLCVRQFVKSRFQKISNRDALARGTRFKLHAGIYMQILYTFGFQHLEKPGNLL